MIDLVCPKRERKRPPRCPASNLDFDKVGVINAMRTGNVVLDMAIAMSIPLVLQGLKKLWDWLRPRLEDYIFNVRVQNQVFRRDIEYDKVWMIYTMLGSS